MIMLGGLTIVGGGILGVRGPAAESETTVVASRSTSTTSPRQTTSTTPPSSTSSPSSDCLTAGRLPLPMPPIMLTGSSR